MDASLLATALDFARHLSKGSFEQAHALLTAREAAQWTPEALEESWETMIDDRGEGVPVPEDVQTDTMEGWPARKAGDAGWVYVPVRTEEDPEAVSMILVTTPEGVRVRQVEFGRP